MYFSFQLIIAIYIYIHNEIVYILYMHVILPADLARHVPKTHLMSETEWRNLGVQQSPGWVHYMMHVPGNFASVRHARPPY
ncbi:cyclin-dependent kinases regulatory subunit 1 isoform X6 [Calliopsis andreniformis]|uniref:cyclin-dependent kinases regulatory subunit 1 isoform X6 n=1 Tax=Calliopsis andreniformis TaxID=337506 RepID=UPI003FCE9052